MWRVEEGKGEDEGEDCQHCFLEQFQFPLAFASLFVASSLSILVFVFSAPSHSRTFQFLSFFLRPSPFNFLFSFSFFCSFTCFMNKEPNLIVFVTAQNMFLTMLQSYHVALGLLLLVFNQAQGAVMCYGLRTNWNQSNTPQTFINDFSNITKIFVKYNKKWESLHIIILDNN